MYVCVFEKLRDDYFISLFSFDYFHISHWLPDRICHEATRWSKSLPCTWNVVSRHVRSINSNIVITSIK